MDHPDDKLLEIRNALMRGRYDEVFRACDALRRQEDILSPRILLYGACALFGLGHVLQSEEWVKAHARVSEAVETGDAGPKNFADTLYLRAFLDLHNRRFDEALLHWTRVTQLDPARTLADELIEKSRRGEEAILRDIRDTNSFKRYIPVFGEPVSKDEPMDESIDANIELHKGDVDNGKLAVSRSVIKPKNRRVSSARSIASRAGIMLVVFLVVTAMIFAGVYLYRPSLVMRLQSYFLSISQWKFSEKKSILPGLPSSGDIIPASEYGKDLPAHIYKNRRAVALDYGSARNRIIKGYPNQARALLGKIELSNAGFEFKERARLLRDSIPIPSANQFLDPVKPEALRSNPYIYRGAQVLYTGTVTEAVKAKSGWSFVLHRDSNTDPVLQFFGGREPFSGPLPATGNRLRVFADFIRLRKDGTLQFFVRELLDLES